MEFEDWECGHYIKPTLVLVQTDSMGLETKRRFLLTEVGEIGLAKPWHVDPEKWSGNG